MIRLYGSECLDDVIEQNQGFRFWKAVAELGFFWEKEGYTYSNLMTRLRDYARPIRAVALSAQLLGLFGSMAAIGCGGHENNPSPVAPTQTEASPTQPNPQPNPNPPPEPTPEPPMPEPVTGVLVGAGDIAVCGSRGTEETARLLDRSPGTVFTAGDNVYPFASAQNFQQCYEPTWGRHKSRTKTAPGNHDWDEADNGVSYFTYFGASAGPRGLGYYSFNVGDAHIISLNSNLRGGEMSAQVSWLQGDLAAHSNYVCTISIFHHPLVSSGPNGDNWHVRDVERALYEANADVVINGHDHDYERFAPQDPNGTLDLKRGLVRLIAGTGGASLYSFVTAKPNSEVRYSGWGVLELTIYKTELKHKFIKVSGEEFDIGKIKCH